MYSLRDLLDRPSLAWRLLSIALALGLAADMLFYKQTLGLSAPIFTALLLAALALAFMSAGAEARRVRQNLWLALPTLFFASMIFLRDEPFLTFLNVLATLLLLGLLFFTLAANPIQRLTTLAYPLVVLIAGVLSAFGALPLVAFLGAHLRQRKRSLRPASRVGAGLLIAAPFLGLFTALFASADAAFAEAARNLLELDIFQHLPDWTAQTVWIGLVTWISAGALLMALARTSNDLPLLETPAAPFFRIGHTEAMTVLISINALFLSFVLIQFAYLFGGRANISVAGFTYAEYARRGFFELVAVAIVTMGLLLSLDWIAMRQGSRQTAAFKVTSLALIAFTLVILASAFQRMSLYESAFGFTSLRLYTHWFMVWMGAVFVLKALALWSDRGQIFAFGGLLSLIVSLAGFNLFNPDAFIAEQNLRRYAATGRLDADYAISMSADAVPVLMAHLDALQPAEKTKIAGGMRFQKDALYAQLSKVNWPSYHWARKQALDALVAKQDQLNTYPPVRSPYRRVD